MSTLLLLSFVCVKLSCYFYARFEIIADSSTFYVLFLNIKSFLSWKKRANPTQKNDMQSLR